MHEDDVTWEIFEVSHIDRDIDNDVNIDKMLILREMVMLIDKLALTKILV